MLLSIACHERERRYLEIGVDEGDTLEDVEANVRVGVDPAPALDTSHLPVGVAILKLPSDSFFAAHTSLGPFDVVLVDGLHQLEQAYRDIINAFRVLSPGGFILVDDVVPSDRVSALRDLKDALAHQLAQGVTDGMWHGDVFRAIFAVSDAHPDVEIHTIQEGGNAQAVLWLAAGADPPAPLDDIALRKYANIDYDSTFAAGVPAVFHPESLEAVMNLARERTPHVTKR